MAEYRRLWVDDARVLEIKRGATIAYYALKTTKIPIGVPFRSAGNGWGVVDLVPWRFVQEEEARCDD
jgi:hypothetical protein